MRFAMMTATVPAPFCQNTASHEPCPSSQSKRRASLSRLLLAVSLAGVLAGCAVGPDYQRPEVTLPATFKQMDGWTQVQPAAPMNDDRWWTRYQDSTLDALVAQVDTANQDLAQAEARYRQALTFIASARAERWH